MDLSTQHPTVAAAAADRRRGATAEEIETHYRERREVFLRVAAQLVGDPQEAHDVVQDAFALALRRAGAFRRDGSLDAWLWRIVVNTARSHGRKRVPAPTALDGHEPFETAEESGDERPALVRAAVARLSARQREVLFLRYYADLDYPAIARALGIRIGTVSATLSQAHAAMRAMLLEVIE